MEQQLAYLLWQTNEGPQVSLIASKARVAPLRQTTTPRLELMAALIASRLANTIYKEFKVKLEVVMLWSDSKIVLHWLRSDSASLKAFVGVRVAEIQSTWDSKCWNFVPTQLNPADDLSRGLTVNDMRGRWMNGPAFLRKPKDEWPHAGASQHRSTSTSRRPRKKEGKVYWYYQSQSTAGRAFNVFQLATTNYE